MKYNMYLLNFIIQQDDWLLLNCLEGFVTGHAVQNTPHMQNLTYKNTFQFFIIFSEIIHNLQIKRFIIFFWMYNQQQQEYLEKDQQEIQQNQEEDFDEEEDEEQEGKWKKIEKPEKCVDLYMIDFNQCDSKKCTGRKMERFGLLKSIKDKKKKFRGVVLSAFGDKPISAEDLPLIAKSGICVIDCSWNRLNETQQFRFKHERILPYVVAGNPVNFGKPFQLSCAQALATALCSIGFVDQAQYIMSKFGWADGFWKINSFLPEYGKCHTIDELQQMSEKNEEAQGMQQQREYIMPSSSESDSD